MRYRYGSFLQGMEHHADDANVCKTPELNLRQLNSNALIRDVKPLQHGARSACVDPEPCPGSEGERGFIFLCFAGDQCSSNLCRLIRFLRVVWGLRNRARASRALAVASLLGLRL